MMDEIENRDETEMGEGYYTIDDNRNRIEEESGNDEKKKKKEKKNSSQSQPDHAEE